MQWVIIFTMKNRTLVFALITVVLVAIGMVSFAWSSRPRLVEVYPQAGATNIPATSKIELVFSRPMEQESFENRVMIEPAISGSYNWEGNKLTFTPDQPWPGGKTITVTLKGGARAASWITFPLGGQSWSFDTSGESLAYLWPADGKANIYALDPLSGEIRQLTKGMDVLDYSVSRDGMMVYFSASNAMAGANLYRLSLTGDHSASNEAYQAELLLDCEGAQCRSPEASADNEYLAYEYIAPGLGSESEPAQIRMLELSSGEKRSVGQEGHETVQPGWSSGGLLAYYDRTDGAYQLYDPKDQTTVSFPNQTGQPGTWSPDSKYYLAPEISYSSSTRGGETGSSHLIRYQAESELTVDLSGADLVEDVEPVYSPDGSFIAFARKFLDAEHWTFGRQIWVMNADGSNSHSITDEADYNHYDLAWSRDGQSLAYVRFNQAKLSEQPELWMVSADGSNPIQLVIGGYSPVWIP